MTSYNNLIERKCWTSDKNRSKSKVHEFGIECSLDLEVESHETSNIRKLQVQLEILTSCRALTTVGDGGGQRAEPHRITQKTAHQLGTSTDWIPPKNCLGSKWQNSTKNIKKHAPKLSRNYWSKKSGALQSWKTHIKSLNSQFNGFIGTGVDHEPQNQPFSLGKEMGSNPFKDDPGMKRYLPRRQAYWDWVDSYYWIIGYTIIISH